MGRLASQFSQDDRDVKALLLCGARPGKGDMYTDSRTLYIDFMLDRVTRDSLLQYLSALPEVERKKFFSINKMEIFQTLYENMVAKTKLA